LEKQEKIRMPTEQDYLQDRGLNKWHYF